MKIKLLLITLFISSFAWAQTLETGVDGTIIDLTPANTTIKNSGFAIKEDASAMAVIGEKVLFVSEDATNGSELWITDGTANGTTLLKDIHPGAESSNPHEFASVGDKVFFAATTPDHGTELWITDGTLAGTVEVVDIYSHVSSVLSSAPDYITPYKDGKVLFKATSLASSVLRGEQWLWISDGTAEGTEMIGQISVSSSGSHGGWRFIQVTESGKAFFIGSDPVFGDELWVTEGTMESTHLVLDIADAPNTEDGAPEGATVSNTIQHLWIVGEDQVVFRSNTPAKWAGLEDTWESLNYELWVTDGTERGTYFLGDYNKVEDPDNMGSTKNTQAAIFGIYDGYVYLRAQGGTSQLGYDSQQVCIARTNLIPEDENGNNGVQFYDYMNWDFQDPPTVWNSWVSDGFVFDDLLYFKGHGGHATSIHGNFGQELCSIDGTEAVGTTGSGIHLVYDLKPGNAAGRALNMMACNNRMYFTADDGDGTTNWEVWMMKKRADFAVDVDQIPVKIFDAPGNGNPQCMTDVNGKLYFIAGASEADRKLYMYDDGQTKAGTDVEPKAALFEYQDFKNFLISAILASEITVSGEGDATIITSDSGTLQMSAVVAPFNAEYETITWSVSPEGIATIDANGLLTATGDGTVTVEATTNTNSAVTGTLDIVVSGQVSIDEIALEYGISVYPNPATEILNISLNYDKDVNLTLINMLGKAVMSKNINNFATIDVSNLTQGVYLIKMNIEGKQYSSKLFIK